MAADKKQANYKKNGIIRTGRKWVLIILALLIIIVAFTGGIVIFGGAVLIAIVMFIMINRDYPPTGTCEFCKTPIKQNPKSVEYTDCPKCHAHLKWVL